jgi:hypothetical protein
MARARAGLQAIAALLVLSGPLTAAALAAGAPSCAERRAVDRLRVCAT